MPTLVIEHRVTIDGSTMKFLEKLCGVRDDPFKEGLDELTKAIGSLASLTQGLTVTIQGVSDDVKEVKHKMATKEELTSALNSVLTEVRKIGEDLTAYLQQIQQQLAEGANVSDQLAQVQEVGAKLQSIDDLLPERIVAEVRPVPEDQTGDEVDAGGTGEQPAQDEG